MTLAPTVLHHGETEESVFSVPFDATLTSLGVRYVLLTAGEDASLYEWSEFKLVTPVQVRNGDVLEFKVNDDFSTCDAVLNGVHVGTAVRKAGP